MFPTKDIEGMLRMQRLGVHGKVTNEWLYEGVVMMSYDTNVGNDEFTAIEFLPPELSEEIAKWEKETGKTVYHVLKNGDEYKYLYLGNSRDDWSIERDALENGLAPVFTNGEYGLAKVEARYMGIHQVV